MPAACSEASAAASSWRARWRSSRRPACACRWPAWMSTAGSWTSSPPAATTPASASAPRRSARRCWRWSGWTRRCATAPSAATSATWHRASRRRLAGRAMAEPRPRIWVSQPLYADIEARLDAWFDVARTAEVTDHAPDAIASALAAADGALVTLNDRIGDAEIAGAPRLRAIANVGVGYNNLDVAALAARGIVATNTPDVLTETTADFGFALMMA